MQIIGEIVTLDNGWLRLTRLAGGPGTYYIPVSAILSNYGRGGRQLQVEIETQSGLKETCAVTQSGHSEYIVLNDNSKKIGDGESSIVLQGESNSPAINVSLGNNASGVSISKIEISTDGGTTWEQIANNTDITDDPGNEDRYLYRVTLAVSQFSMSSGNVVEVPIRCTDTALATAVLRPSKTVTNNQSQSYNVSSGNQLVVTGASNSSSLTIGGTLATGRTCTMYISFDNGATWAEYTPGTLLTEASVERGEYYLFKVVVDTTGISAETADMALVVYDNTNTARATTTVNFTERV